MSGRKFLWLLPWVVIGLGVFLVDPFLDRCGRVDWVGHQEIKLRFLVVDSQTQQPLEGALLRCFEEDEPVEVVVKRQTQTDADGEAQLTESCQTYGARSFPRYRKSAVAHLPDWVIRVSKEGYETSEGVSIFAKTRGRVDLLKQSSPPLFRIELSRTSP